MPVHAAAHVEQQRQIERLGLLPEIGNLFWTPVIENCKVGLLETLDDAPIAIHHLGIHFHQRDAGAKRRTFSRALLRERQIPQ